MSLKTNDAFSSATLSILQQLQSATQPQAVLQQALDDASKTSSPEQAKLILRELEQILETKASVLQCLPAAGAVELKRFIAAPRSQAMHPQLRVLAQAEDKEVPAGFVAKMRAKGLEVEQLSFQVAPSELASGGAFKLGVFYKQQFAGSIDVVCPHSGAYPMLVATVPAMRGKGLGAFLHVAAALMLQEKYGTTLFASEDNSSLEQGLWDSFASKGLASMQATRDGDKLAINQTCLQSPAACEVLALIKRQELHGDESWISYPQDTYSISNPVIPAWALLPGE